MCYSLVIDRIGRSLAKEIEMGFTKSEASRIASLIEAKVDEVLQAEGLDKGRTSITYGADLQIKLSIQSVESGKNGVNTATPEAQALTSLSRYLMPTQDLTDDERANLIGTVADIGGRTLRLDGYNSRARKMPVVMTEIGTGKLLKASESYLTYFVTAIREEASNA